MQTSWSMQLERELLNSTPDASKVPVRLISADGETFVVEKHSAIVSNLISYKLFHQPGAVEYPLRNVSGRILSLVLEFCTTHTATLSFGGAVGAGGGGRNPAFLEIEKPMTQGTDLARYVERWDLSFIQKLEKDPKLLRLVFYAANYLDIKPLFELICASVACKFVSTAFKAPDSEYSGQFDDDFNMRRTSSFHVRHRNGAPDGKKHAFVASSSSSGSSSSRSSNNASTSSIGAGAAGAGGEEKAPGAARARAAAQGIAARVDHAEAYSFSTTEREWWSNENAWLVEQEPGDMEDDVHLEQLDSRLKMSYVCSNLFREFDDDGNCTLDPAELKDMLNEACKRAGKAYEDGDFTTEQAEDVIGVFDSDGDQLVSLGEFLGWMENLSEAARVHYEDSQMVIEKKLGTFFTALEKIADEIPDREATDISSSWHMFSDSDSDRADESADREVTD